MSIAQYIGVHTIFDILSIPLCQRPVIIVHTLHWDYLYHIHVHEISDVKRMESKSGENFVCSQCQDKGEGGGLMIFTSKDSN